MNSSHAQLEQSESAAERPPLVKLTVGASLLPPAGDDAVADVPSSPSSRPASASPSSSWAHCAGPPSARPGARTSSITPSRSGATSAMAPTAVLPRRCARR
jgi:hypothetical protein